MKKAFLTGYRSLNRLAAVLTLVLFLSFEMAAQYAAVTEVTEVLSLSEPIRYKILSGMLTKEVVERNQKFVNGSIGEKDTYMSVAVYYREAPGAEELQQLSSIGVRAFPETWTPPLPNHPLGFILAQMPSGKFLHLLNLESVQRVAPTFETSEPQNNFAIVQMGADKIWQAGYTGTGVKIAVLDSGLDDFYDGTDLPTTYERKDYSNYPISTDDGVQNTVSGHGTHVTGSVLGKGTLSNSHSSLNGTGPFKGAAPGADLVFLKIGSDANSNASDDAMIGAVEAAVTTYNADIITMSYGGWDGFHDGSSPVEQKFDWAVAQGVTCFVSAGNNAALSRHFSGTVPANGSTDFITVNLNDGQYSSYYASFNLVYADGIARSGLDLQYFNSGFNLIPRTRFGASESSRGTDQEYFQSTNGLTTNTYYLKVVNPSGQAVDFHLYELNGGGFVRFASPDPFYTTGHPANADHVIAVGAYVSRFSWVDATGVTRSFTGQNQQHSIANFSSRGPRIDGVQKPEIVGPGSGIISLMDTDVTTNANLKITNSGVINTTINYSVNQGTSMACPLVAGAAALYLQKHPGATPAIIKNALITNTSKSVTEAYPNATWGYGKLDIFSAINSVPSLDGYCADPAYTNLSSFTSMRNGFGDDNELKTLKYYNDGTDIYVGITGELTANDNLILFFNFSGYGGRGGNTLGNSGSDAGVFKNIGGARMDFDVDFAIAMNEGNSGTNFFIDACRYGNPTAVVAQGALGNTGSQLGLSGTFNAGTVFGGTGNLTVAYHSGFTSDSLRGIEMKIPLSAFAGVNSTHTLELFAVIVSSGGVFSNECIPGDPGETNPGMNPNFNLLTGGGFHTGITALPVQLSAFSATSTEREVVLNWTTETEENAYQFVVERKGAEDPDFSLIGEVPASGNSNSPKQYTFTDRSLNSGVIAYRLRMIDNDGTYEYSNTIEAEISVPSAFGLSQNYPNPFNPTTKIDYQLPLDSFVRLDLYTITGELVRTLVQAEQKAGYHTVPVSATEGMSTGVYVYRLHAVAGGSAKPYTSVKKMVLIR